MQRRMYQVWVYVLPMNEPAPFTWELWKTVYDLLKDFCHSARGKSQFRAMQTIPKNKTYGPDYLLWNLKNLEKVAHYSPITEPVSQQLRLYNFELSCPSEKVCLTDRHKPDMLLQLHSLSCSSEDRCYILQFIVAHDKPDFQSAIQISQGLVQLFKPVAIAEIVSPWVLVKLPEESPSRKISRVRYFFRPDWDWQTKPSQDMLNLEGTNATLKSFIVTPNEKCSEN